MVQEGLNVAGVHHLGDHGHAELGAGLHQKVEALLAHALVGVGGGAGLVGSAAQHGGAGGLDRAGDLDEVPALDGAGAGHDLEVAAAHLDAEAAVYDGVLWVELAVGLLEGLGHALDALDDVHALEQERVDLRGVADDADDGLVLAARDVGLEPAVLDPLNEMPELLLRGRALDDCYHVSLLLLWSRISFAMLSQANFYDLRPRRLETTLYNPSCLG